MSLPPHDTPPDPFPGEYRLRQLLGEGAHGAVWLADDLKLACPVAMKTVRGRPSALAALERDARFLARIRHPNVVRVHCWREANGQPWLVLQYVAGGSLDQVVRERGALPWHQAGRYVADVGEGLREVHRLGILHRDIKPANILLETANGKDEALLADFGLAALPELARTSAGTPLYMAPEQLQGQATEKSDVYSLAATLFHTVTGGVPYAGNTLDELFANVRRGLPDPDARCRAMPEPLEQVLRAALAAEPAQRPTLEQFLQRLRGALNRGLADSLAPTQVSQLPVDLRLVVSRQEGSQFRPIAATQARAERSCRDMQKVPATPEQVRLVTGERVRLEVCASQSGHVVVFNVGPTGNLNLLFPEQVPASTAAGTIQPNQPLHILDVELTPPAGRERLCAIWSQAPLPALLEQLSSLVDNLHVGSHSYRATRDLKRLQASVQQLPAGTWHAVVLEMDHQPRSP